MPTEPWATIAAANARIHRVHVLFQLIIAALWVIAAGAMGSVVIAAVVVDYAADQPEKLISVLLIAFCSMVLATLTLSSASEMEQASRNRLGTFL